MQACNIARSVYSRWIPAKTAAFLALFLLICSTSLPAGQESASQPIPIALPSEVTVPRYSPGPNTRLLDAGAMTFRISWMGIPAGGATFELHHHALMPKMLVGEAHLYTNSFVDNFYMMRNYVREDFTRATLSPQDIYIVQRENKRHNEFTIAFDPAGRLVSSIKRSHKGVENYSFLSDNPSGLFSGAMMALSQPLDIGKSYTFDVFTAINRYVIRLDVRRREHVQTALGDFDAILIAPYIVYWRDGWPRGTARNVKLWVSADSRHLPLRLESATMFGTIRADLTELAPTSDFPRLSSSQR